MRTGQYKGNTVGSRSKTKLAYIAGFLDGDGSLMMQIKKRGDTTRGFRFMLTICFYQDSQHEEPLYWIREVLNIGYISKRKDGITELRINGFSQVKNVLKLLLPYIQFKRVQAKLLLEAAALLEIKHVNEFSNQELRALVNYIVAIQNRNYKSVKRRRKQELLHVLGLTP